MLTAVLLAASGQTVDYAILGFADNDGNQISSIEMTATQSLQPRVILKNNGPNPVAATDSVIFEITHEQWGYAASLLLLGTQLHSVSAGEQVIIDLAQPIWTASVMDEYSITEGTICYEVRIFGVSTDPNPNNNKACIPFSRPLAISDFASTSVSLFPNPASTYVTITGVENARVQLFDLSGKLLATIDNAADNQQLDVSPLTSGLYIVRISDGKNVVTRKLNVVR